MKFADATRTGIAFATNVALGYALCSFVFWLWPGAGLAFMNGLLHGLDFQELQDSASLFSFGSFGYAIVALTAWAFVLGSVYGCISGSAALSGWIGSRLLA